MHDFYLISYYRTEAGFGYSKLKNGQDRLGGGNGFSDLEMLAGEVKAEMSRVSKDIPVTPINMVPETETGTRLSPADENKMMELLS